MTQADAARLTELTEQESRFVFDSFDHATAWRLGALMVERGLREKLPVIIDIRRPGVILFRSALAGVTAENEVWLDRKARTALRFEASTALVAARFAAQGVDVWAAPWFDPTQFAPTGGSVPVRVHGTGVVGAVTVSGLASDEDHAFVIDAFDAYLRSEPRSS